MSAQPTPVAESDIMVGSYFLETLTTGMYENPFDCIREYVQNGFDAIQDARTNGSLRPGDGRVQITVTGTGARSNIAIRDDGVGIPSGKAAATLISLGASRKSHATHAGFRGIGRLAGVAYCTTLRFTTSAAGETEATVVEFDCGKLRGLTAPGGEPQDIKEVLRKSVTWSTKPASVEHFTEVEMVGLTGLGQEFADLEKLTTYLQQVAPVDYKDGFDYAERIRQLAVGFGSTIPHVEVSVKAKRERVPVHKPYQNTHAGSRGPAKIHDIESITSKELGWFGWIGLSNFPSELVDEAAAGVRFRIKNIQIGDSGIIEDIAAALTASGTDRRLQRWAIGEIYITNPKVVPNARRDGFEDSRAWRDVSKDIRDRVAKRVVTLVREASDSRGTIKEVRKRYDYVRPRLNVAWINPTEAERLAKEINKQLGKLAPENMTGVEPLEVSQMVSQFKELQERLDALPKTPPPAPPLPPPPAEPEQQDPDPEPEDVPPEPEPPLTLMDVVRQVLIEQLGEADGQRLIAAIERRWQG